MDVASGMLVDAVTVLLIVAAVVFYANMRHP